MMLAKKHEGQLIISMRYALLTYWAVVGCIYLFLATTFTKILFLGHGTLTYDEYPWELMTLATINKSREGSLIPGVIK